MTDMEDATRYWKINSAQNGFIVQKTLQQLFDQYLISINPDNCYNVVVFSNNFFNYDGRILDPACQNPADPHHVR